MIEIERKFRLSPEQAVNIRRILTQRYGTLRHIHQIDEVFLYKIESFREFTVGMPVARLRTEDNITYLTYKRALNSSGDMLEHELALESPEPMLSILLDMGYHSITIVDKQRLEVKDEKTKMSFMLDRVKELGNFLEIEILAPNDDDLSQAELQIMHMAETLGLSSQDIESKKYDQLMSSLRI